MSVVAKFYDQHTLYVDCGAISKKNLERILGSSILPLKAELKNLNIALDTFHELKLVVNKEGISLGKAYLWVRDPQLYNILNGLNADGSKREETYPDPDWEEPSSPGTGNIVDFAIPKGVNWADFIEEEEEMQRPMKTVKLPPLLQFNEYEYSEEESKLAKEIIDLEWRKETLLLFYQKVKLGDTKDWNLSEQEYNKFIKYFEDDNIPETATAKSIDRVLRNLECGEEIDLNTLFEDVGSFANKEDDTPLLGSQIITISGAWVTNVEDTQLKDILTTKVYPAILDPTKDKATIAKLGKLAVKNREGKYEVKIIPDEKTMVDKFLPYTTTKEAKDKNGKIQKYPIYSFNSKSNVLSMNFFDRKGRDAQFALLMNRKIDYVDPNTGLHTILNFALGKNFGGKY